MLLGQVFEGVGVSNAHERILAGCLVRNDLVGFTFRSVPWIAFVYVPVCLLSQEVLHECSRVRSVGFVSNDCN